MNAIVGFTNLALQTQDDKEKVQEYLTKIKVSSDHLLSLINDILEMSRIENGKIELDEQPCNLPEVLHELNTIIVAQVESKQQELHMDALNVVDENILCDRLRLNQVLLNLLSNAVKYTPTGGKINVRIIQDHDADVPKGYGKYEIRTKWDGPVLAEITPIGSNIWESFSADLALPDGVGELYFKFVGGGTHQFKGFILE